MAAHRVQGGAPAGHFVVLRNALRVLFVIGAGAAAQWAFGDDEAEGATVVAPDATADPAELGLGTADSSSRPDRTSADAAVAGGEPEPTRAVLIALECARLDLAVALAEAVTPSAESARRLTELRSARGVVLGPGGPDAWSDAAGGDAPVPLR